MSTQTATSSITAAFPDGSTVAYAIECSSEDLKQKLSGRDEKQSTNGLYDFINKNVFHEDLTKLEEVLTRRNITIKALIGAGELAMVFAIESKNGDSIEHSVLRISQAEEHATPVLGVNTPVSDGVIKAGELTATIVPKCLPLANSEDDRQKTANILALMEASGDESKALANRMWDFKEGQVMTLSDGKETVDTLIDLNGFKKTELSPEKRAELRANLPAAESGADLEADKEKWHRVKAHADQKALTELNQAGVYLGSLPESAVDDPQYVKMGAPSIYLN